MGVWPASTYPRARHHAVTRIKGSEGNMDLLRFIASLPVRLVRGLPWLLAMPLPPIFGNMSWPAPAGVPATGRAARQHPLKFIGTIAGVLILAAAGWFGWHWWENRPKPAEPNRITFEAPAPDISDYDHVRVTIHPLTVMFSASAAKLESLGKPVTDGIAMDPKLAGQWTWENDRTLKFVPAADWPVGRKIEVRFDKAKVFAPHVLLADDHFDVATAPFTARVVNGEFYQDPQDPTKKKTIVQLCFNYPVDARERDTPHQTKKKKKKKERRKKKVNTPPKQNPPQNGFRAFSAAPAPP